MFIKPNEHMNSCPLYSSTLHKGPSQSVPGHPQFKKGGLRSLSAWACASIRAHFRMYSNKCKLCEVKHILISYGPQVYVLKVSP